MINYLKNLLKKPETKPEQQKKYNYNREIALIITYNQPDDEFREYKRWQVIETDDVNDYSEQKEKVEKEYEQLIKTLHKELDDKSSEYIVLNDSFLLKKVDFVNVKITIVDN